MPPLLLGHRGARASRHVPENTLESFELCLQHGCDGFEFDVRLSNDGQAVICHDPTSRKLKIDRTSSLLLCLPTLAQILQQFSKRAFLDIELKAAGLERTTVEALAEFPPQKGYVVSSFLPEVINAIHAIDATILLGCLCDSRKQLRGWKGSPAEWVIPRRDLADEALISNVHRAGKKAMIWTVNRSEDMQVFADWGVDALISDETELLVGTVK